MAFLELSESPDQKHEDDDSSDHRGQAMGEFDRL